MLPGLAPHPADDRQLRPFGFELLEGDHRLIGVDRRVDRSEVFGDLVVLLARHVFQ